MDKCTEVPGADPDFLLVDGNRFGDHLIPRRCLVKGDSRSISIAAASILAKVYRDRLMAQLHEEYPYFGDRKSTRLNSSHVAISYAVFCLKKKRNTRCD